MAPCSQGCLCLHGVRHQSMLRDSFARSDCDPPRLWPAAHRSRRNPLDSNRGGHTEMSPDYKPPMGHARKQMFSAKMSAQFERLAGIVDLAIWARACQERVVLAAPKPQRS